MAGTKMKLTIESIGNMKINTEITNYIIVITGVNS